jgi:hypothetical protein
MKYFEEALKLIPSSSLIVYRGFGAYKQQKQEVGDYVFWHTINSTSKNIDIAKGFTTERGTLFTIHAKHAKDIRKLSAYP